MFLALQINVPFWQFLEALHYMRGKPVSLSTTALLMHLSYTTSTGWSTIFFVCLPVRYFIVWRKNFSIHNRFYVRIRLEKLEKCFEQWWQTACSIVTLKWVESFHGCVSVLHGWCIFERKFVAPYLKSSFFLQSSNLQCAFWEMMVRYISAPWKLVDCECWLAIPVPSGFECIYGLHERLDFCTFLVDLASEVIRYGIFYGLKNGERIWNRYELAHISCVIRFIWEKQTSRIS